MEPFGFVRCIRYGNPDSGSRREPIKKAISRAGRIGRPRFPCNNRGACHPVIPPGARARRCSSSSPSRPCCSRRCGSADPSTSPVAFGFGPGGPAPLRSRRPRRSRHRRHRPAHRRRAGLRRRRHLRCRRGAGPGAPRPAGRPTGPSTAHQRGRAPDDADQGIRRRDATRLSRGAGTPLQGARPHQARRQPANPHPRPAERRRRRRSTGTTRAGSTSAPRQRHARRRPSASTSRTSTTTRSRTSISACSRTRRGSSTRATGSSPGRPSMKATRSLAMAQWAAGNLEAGELLEVLGASADPEASAALAAGARHPARAARVPVHDRAQLRVGGLRARPMAGCRRVLRAHARVDRADPASREVRGR